MNRFPPPAARDDTVSLSADDIDAFILKRLAQELKGHAFVHFVAHLLSKLGGGRTRISPEGPDGLDIVVDREALGVEGILKVQVKSNQPSIGLPVVAAFFGSVSGNERALLLTPGTFTEDAHSFARSNHNLGLMDGTRLVNLLCHHYEKLDSRYKLLLRLERGYGPEALDGDQ